MRKLALLTAAFALVAVLFFGCDETNPTEPEATIVPTFGAGGMPSSVSSTFDSGNEGWTLVGDAYRAWTGYWPRSLYPGHDPSAGNPGGAVYAEDMARGIFYYWQAPPRYLGNRIGMYGGALVYDVKAIGSGGPTDGTDVVLAGDGKTLVIRLNPSVGPAWTTVRADLTEGAGWRHEDPISGTPATAEDLKAVLKDLTVLHIRGEYLDLVDTGYLDNVRMIPKGQAQ